MAINFLLKRSAVASKRPTAAQIDIGELSLNYESASPGLFFEDDLGTVRKIGPVEVSSSEPNSTPAGSSGNSVGEQWLDTSVSPPVLKTYDGTAWKVVGTVTIGSTSIGVGSSSTVLAGLTDISSTDLNITGTIDLQDLAEARFFEDSTNGSNSVGFKAPTTITSDFTWTLPGSDGLSGYVLSTDGSGVLSWQDLTSLSTSFPTGDYGDLTSASFDPFGILLQIGFDCLTDPPGVVATFDCDPLT